MTWRLYCKACDAPLGTMVFTSKPENLTGTTTSKCPTCGETYDYMPDDLEER